MKLKNKKLIALGKGLKINFNQKSATISGSYKWLRFNIHKGGIKATAKIPGTDISYTQDIPVPKGLQKWSDTKVEVVEKKTLHVFFTREVPQYLKSQYYNLYSIIGLIGIIFVFAAFVETYFFFVGVFFVYLKFMLQRRTDETALAYKDAYRFFRTRKFDKSIKELHKVMKHPMADKKLKLVLAECYLELNDEDKAYEAYVDFFSAIDPIELDSSDYWSPKANAILMSLERENYDLALSIAEGLRGEDENIDFKLWRNYFKGLVFMGKQQYEMAIHAFKDAIGKKRSMEAPYIDAHYLLGVAYGITGKNSLAKERFQRVYSANSNYKSIKNIINEIEKGRKVSHIIEDIQ
ncbi:DUF4236 domain-containing protein [Alkaliphilus serpentinus]|nr:DUF4236 domain-containing protein [Alkaliphilus serpentinus]